MRTITELSFHNDIGDALVSARTGTLSASFLGTTITSAHCLIDVLFTAGAELNHAAPNDTSMESLIIGVTFFSVVIIVVAAIGNVLVIHIVCSVQHMRNSTNKLIANMAVADLLMAIDLPYITKWLFVHDRWFGTFAGSALCKIFHSAQAASVACSVLSLVAISFDRSLAILYPMRTIFTPNVTRAAVAFTWLGALAFAIPLMVGTSVYEDVNGDLVCNELWSNEAQTAYGVSVCILTYAIPLLLIAVVYLLTGMRLWSRKLPGQRNLLSLKSQQAARDSSRRATVMLITVVVVFALFWLPFQAREVIRLYSPELAQKIPVIWMFLCPFIGFSNSAINPILYVIFSENYRREFTRILWHRQSARDQYRTHVIRRYSSTRTTRMSRDQTSNAMPLYKHHRDSDATRQPSKDMERIESFEV